MSKVSNENNEYVSQIIQDARNVYSQSKKRHQTLFFKIVTGGTSNLISQVITSLKSSGEREDTDLLQWLIGQDNGNVEVKQRGQLCIIILKAILVIPLWIILTPIFYLVHGILYGLMNSSFVFSITSISKYDHLDFPLAFAVLSTNEEMVKLFMINGIGLDCNDSRGNNVFHYLADLSRTNLPLAQACYRMLQNLIPRQKLWELVLHRQNGNHYTPIEYATHFGSVQFAVQMVEDTMQEKVLIANSDNATISTNKQGNYQSTFIDEADKERPTTSGASCSSVQLNTPNSLHWAEERMNVSVYEISNRNGQCSFLLNLLISRSPVNISESEIKYVNENVCLQRWMFQKLKQWSVLIVVVALLEIAVSLVFTLGVLQSVQGDFNLAPNRDQFVNAHTQAFLGLLKNTVPTDTYYNLSQSFFEAYPDIEASLSSGADQMDYVQLKNLIRQIPEYNNFDSSDMTSLYETYCVTGSVYVLVGDLVRIDNCTKQAAENFIVSCKEVNAKYGSIFVNPEHNERQHEYAIATSFEIQIYRDKLSVFTNTLRVELTRTDAYAMLLFVLTYACLYLFLDIFSRLQSLMKQLKYNISFYFLFATPIEGSYVKGQANCFSLFAYLLIVCYYWGSISSFYGTFQDTEVTLRDEFLFYDGSNADYVTINLAMCFFFVFLFAFRIILHLNLFKLIPWIGKFIITTFQLTVDLLHFTVVYVVIVFFFASLFHFVARDKNCPDYRDDENKFVYSSVFSTFALTFGHVDFSFQNDAVKMAYVLFVVMSIILLLNLIIALMGTTASLITNQPWLPFLIRQAYVQETIGLESWVSRIFGCSMIRLAGLKAAGFVVENDKSKTHDVQVYVQVFDVNNAH